MTTPQQKVKVLKDIMARKVPRGRRTYNGLPSNLMNKVYDGLISRDEAIPDKPWWPIFSLYLARTLGVIEQETQINKLK